ncbi:MAG TPA: hypothetical protein VM866_08290 [Pyrinomonadaceae bacterium]|jgi:hypothetical protein|nr:hypothetical protein [Pyrinomonadaceae bacterium]
MINEIFGLFADWAEEVLRYAVSRIGDRLPVPVSLQASVGNAEHLTNRAVM